MSSGEDKRFHYPDWQTHIHNVRIAENRLDVTEVQTITVDAGTFHHLYRSIPSKRATVENVTASFDSTALRNDSSQQPGTYNANLDGQFTYINAYLPQPINAGESHTLELNYTLKGALRDGANGRNLLIWPNLPTENKFRIDAAQITLDFPPNRMLYFLETLPPTWSRHQPTPTQMVLRSPGGEPVTNGLEIRATFIDQRPPRQRRVGRSIVVALVLMLLVMFSVCGLTTFVPVFSGCMHAPSTSVRDCAGAGFAGVLGIVGLGGVMNNSYYDSSYDGGVNNYNTFNSGSSSSSNDSSSSYDSSSDSGSSVSSDSSSGSSDSGSSDSGDSGGDSGGD